MMNRDLNRTRRSFLADTALTSEATFVIALQPGLLRQPCTARVNQCFKCRLEPSAESNYT